MLKLRIDLKKQETGFTLIELLVVIAIIAILVTIVVVAIDPVRQIQKAQDSKRRADLNQIKAAMQLYYNDCKAYPLKSEYDAVSGAAWDGGDDAVTCSAASTTYMKQVPAGYTYTSLNGAVACAATPCTDYVITADLSTDDTNRSTEDGNTVTKCGQTAADDLDFAVCND